MKIFYELTFDDLFEFHKHFIFNSKTCQRSKKIYHFSIPAILISLTIVNSIFLDFDYINVPFLMATVTWIIFFPKIWENIISKQCERILREGVDKNKIGNVEMELTDNYLILKAKVFESKLSWEGVYEYKEDERYMYIYTSGISAYIIPKFKTKPKNILPRALELLHAKVKPVSTMTKKG